MSKLIRDVETAKTQAGGAFTMATRENASRHQVAVNITGATTAGTLWLVRVRVPSRIWAGRADS